MTATRLLSVIADDFGIGPETTRGILHLAARGVVTGTVLLVNSPHAAEAVRGWRQAGVALDVGWHPCLTLDTPLSAPGQVASLVNADGLLYPLGQFLRRLSLGLIRSLDIERELRAQYARYVQLVGRSPTLVNSHQHVSLFGPVGKILRAVLADCRPRPFLRRVCEPWKMLARIPGARIKRAVLTLLGRIETRRQARDEFPGADWLAGITDPPFVTRPDFFARWLASVPGEAVELACHPGFFDATLIGRDARGPQDGLLLRRVHEFHLLSDPSFEGACRAAGFVRVGPSEMLHRRAAGGYDVAA
jgi:predicted glycoside hydrolase/deacetylase ChbG (UPF0249 family)